MMNWLRRFLRYMAFEHGRLGRLYLRVCRPIGTEFAAYWKRRELLHSVGDGCSFNIDVNITDPAYTSIGSNCILSSCTLLGHDAVAAMLNNVHGTKVDAVGKIVIHDNCFVGHGAIVMPDTTIGPDSIVAAGAVVTKDVPPGTVVGGVPARFICTTADLLERMKSRSAAYPWMDLIERREGSYDAAMEPELVRQRVKYFFGDA
jgi:acetyltransferase-like isoleucine patch superfamily enzyme